MLVWAKWLQLAVLPQEKSSVAGQEEVTEVLAPLGCDMRLPDPHLSCVDCGTR